LTFTQNCVNIIERNEGDIKMVTYKVVEFATGIVQGTFFNKADAEKLIKELKLECSDDFTILQF